MDQIWNEIKSPLFWFSVVLVSLIVNIGGAIALRKWDKASARRSTRLQAELEAKQNERSRRVKLMVENDEMLQLTQSEYVATWLRLIGLILVVGAFSQLLLVAPFDYLVPRTRATFLIRFSGMMLLGMTVVMVFIQVMRLADTAQEIKVAVNVRRKAAGYPAEARF
jgi:hypothetical protein